MLDKLSLRWKTVLIALLSLPLPLIAAAYAVYAVAQAERRIAEIAAEELPIAKAVTDISVTQREQAIHFERALLYGKEMTAKPALLAKFDANSSAFEAKAARIEADFAALLTLIEQAEAAGRSAAAVTEFDSLLAAAKAAIGHQQSYDKVVRDLFESLRAGKAEDAARHRAEVLKIEEVLGLQLAAAQGRLDSFARQTRLTVQAQTRSALMITIALFLAALLGGPMIALAVARSLGAPITRVANTLTRLAAGERDLGLETLGRQRDEIGHLARVVEDHRDTLNSVQERNLSLTREIEQCQAAEERLKQEREQLERRMEERAQSLRDNEQRFKDFALSSAERFWEMGADLRFTWLDEPGRPDRLPLINAIIGKTRWEVTGADVDHDPRWQAHRADLEAHQPFRDFEYEVGQGTEANTWWRVSGVPTFADDGSFTGYRGVGADITERKRAQKVLVQQSADLKEANAALKVTLEQRDTLLKELQHRVKNSLQVVVSLLNLRASQAPESTTKEAILEGSQRVEALSLAHRFLYQPDFPGQTVLSEYIPALCKMLSQAYDIGTSRVEVAIDVAPISVPLSKITPVSLLLNELISNAFKHAFPDNRKGTISILMEEETDDTGARCLHLCVADDGIGLPNTIKLDATSSMGLMIFRSLVGQIDGTVEIHRGQGTAVHVRFPLESDGGAVV